MNWPELFDEQGYLNMRDIIELNYPFTFVTGARQIGKTYGTIKYMLEHGHKFVYLRRTQTELDAAKTPALSPFTQLNIDLGYDIQAKPLAKNVTGFYDMSRDMKNLIAPGLALTTLHNVRGISGAEYDYIVYDEFIPELVARPIKGEFDAWSNAYETLNSNRELSGGKPMQYIMLANSNMAANPIFMGLGLVRILERMKNQKQIYYDDKGRGILIVNVEGSPISAKKKDSALGRLTKGTDFARMAYDNEFAFDDFTNIESRSLKEYKAFKAVGEICIYKHKSRNEYYVSEHFSGSPAVFGSSEREIDYFSRGAGPLRDAYLAGRVWFENYLVKILFIKYTN